MVYLTYRSDLKTRPSKLVNIFVEYYDGGAGGVCDDESHVIRSIEKCTAALQILGYKVTKSFYLDGPDNSIPSGCSIRNTGDQKPHMKTSLPGLGKGRRDLTPICEGAKMKGKFLLSI